MTRMRLTRWLISLSCLLALLLTSYILFPSKAEAQYNLRQEVEKALQQLKSIILGKRGVGVSTNRDHGAVRDPDLCPPARPSLTALVPNLDEPVMTSEVHPAFWFYIPFELTDDFEKFTLRFVLQDEENNDIYQTAFRMPNETLSPGILSLRLQSQKAALEIGKTYRWYFLIYCDDPQGRYEPAFVEGLIRREALGRNLRIELDQAVLQERFMVYVNAETLFWYDILAALAEARQTYPDNSSLTNAWSEILEIIDLDDVKDEPIIGQYYVPSRIDIN
ncbi:MAG: DUF928 domain-containing protein [Leptolyngbyaceae cyanobacterium MO_188.B28]|nr:DUF928 domain-containing protein [Leptolyngbyaceae cyanobacterium MO_188.B28]